MIQIKYFRCENEAKAVEAFLRWQGYTPEVIDTTDALLTTKGRFLPILIENGKTQAIGYFEIVKFFESSGRISC